MKKFSPTKLLVVVITIVAVLASGLLVYSAMTDWSRIDIGQVISSFEGRDGLRYRIENISSSVHNYFIPNKTVTEWNRFKNAAITGLPEINLEQIICGSDVSYGGELYPTVQIGTQCWLAKNLNIGTFTDSNVTSTNNGIIEKYCYNNVSSDCNTWGGLYQRSEAVAYREYGLPPEEQVQGICPVGWHIPKPEEFTTLINYLAVEGQGGAGTNAGAKLKEAGTTHWRAGNNGTNTSGFTAFGAGDKGGYEGPERNDPLFYDRPSYGLYWATACGAGGCSVGQEGTVLELNYAWGGVGAYTWLVPRMMGVSVRCLLNY